MKTERPRIPVPWRQRWQDVRLRLLPTVVFVSAVCAMAILWKQNIGGTAMVGQAEPVLASVSSYKAGVLAEFNATRFQKVRAGDPLGQVLVTDPRILATTLAVIQSEIELLRLNMKPIVAQQQNAIDYDHFRLDWMKQRAQLASARINLQLAEAEHRRMEELFKDKIVSGRVYEQARGTRDRLQSEVDELVKLVTDGEQNFRDMHVTNGVDISKVSTDPMLAAIAVQEAKLRQTEAELSPVVLRAPMDGIVSVIYCRSGEAVTAGQPIASIATLNPVRIVGYVKPPILGEPKVGMRVEVRTRGLRREAGAARIMEVGSQLEAMPAVLIGSKFATTELGLPLDISLPPNLKIRPGELVDLRLLSQDEHEGL